MGKHLLLPAAASALLLTTLLSSAQVIPGERFGVPVEKDLPGVISDSSSLIATLGDAAGNTLYVISHKRTVAGPGFTVVNEVARQWIMVSGRGTPLGKRTFRFDQSGFPSDVVFFSRQRILARTDSGNGVFIEAFRPTGTDLEPEGLAVGLEIESGSGSGKVASESLQRQPQRFFDIVVSDGGKVTSIRRFDSKKVRPELP